LDAMGGADHGKVDVFAVAHGNLLGKQAVLRRTAVKHNLHPLVSRPAHGGGSARNQIVGGRNPYPGKSGSC
ncbi:MAG TPA: hypothetical protein VGN98_04915, partial [Tianweitania sediminis]|nr:hypothetical protein [Tianweitania sediminis]